VERHLVDAAYRRDASLAWLTGFARYLTLRESRQLDLSGPLTPASWGKYRRTALSFAVAAVACVLVANFGRLIELINSRRELPFGILAWALALLAFATVRLASRRVDVAPPFRFRVKLRRVMGGVACAALMALILGFFGAISPQRTTQLDQPLAIGLLGLVVIFATLSVFGWHSFTEPLDDGQVTHPLDALLSDGQALLAHFPLPLVYTTLYCATLGQWSEFYGTLAIGLLASTGVPDRVPGLAWSRWCLRSVLLQRRIPASDRGFGDALEEARELGVLRASGTRYRFQHAKIHDQLAALGAEENFVRTARQ
jgi:hypothetical protein